MKKLLRKICSAGLVAAALLAGGCGGGGGDGSVAADPNTVVVAGAGSVSAAAANIPYSFLPGTYTYNISGFAAGDKLLFPAGATPTVDNDNYFDGRVTIQWAGNGNVISVILTGLTDTQDGALRSIEKINLLFGNGTVQ